MRPEIIKKVKVQMILYSYTWYQKYGDNEKETTNFLCNYTREILYGIREYVNEERNHEYIGTNLLYLVHKIIVSDADYLYHYG